QHKGGNADEQHHESAEHERRTEDRADPDLVRIRGTREEDRDHRDERLWGRRPDRRKDAAGGAFADPQLEAEPFDAVREDLSTREDEDERSNDERDVYEA